MLIFRLFIVGSLFIHHKEEWAKIFLFVEVETLDQWSQFIAQHLQGVRAKKKGQVPRPDGKPFKLLIGRRRLPWLLRIQDAAFSNILDIKGDWQGLHQIFLEETWKHSELVFKKSVLLGAANEEQSRCPRLSILHHETLKRLKVAAPLTAGFKDSIDFLFKLGLLGLSNRYSI